jgi:hypothetical protein
MGARRQKLAGPPGQLVDEHQASMATRRPQLDETPRATSTSPERPGWSSVQCVGSPDLRDGVAHAVLPVVVEERALRSPLSGHRRRSVSLPRCPNQARLRLERTASPVARHRRSVR